MNSPFAISVRSLGKQYHLPTADSTEYQMLSEKLARMIKAPWSALRRRVSQSSDPTFWAVDDVSFDLKQGEAVAVIGRNGAGKSTLLKILARITSPTKGEAILQGRVGSLLEVGTGFHPELSGRENVFLNGGILGMTRNEIRRHFDAIVEFSGVERFLDLPVKRYSSGMRVRLAFAVAAHLDPEILIVDEVLAVGDLAFQRKCMQRMNEVASDGRTVLFVSHNMPAVESLCPRSLMLRGGQLVADGDTHEVVRQYIDELRINQLTAGIADVDLSEHGNRRANSTPLLTRLSIRDEIGEATNQLGLGSPVNFDLRYVNEEQKNGLGFAVFICNEQGQRLAMFHSRVHSQLISTDETSGAVRCHVPELPLLPGNYRVDVGVGTWDSLLDYIEHAASIQILPTDFLGTGELPNQKQGFLALPASWTAVETSGCQDKSALGPMNDLVANAVEPPRGPTIITAPISSTTPPASPTH